jgi:hypothetical protein
VLVPAFEGDASASRRLRVPPVHPRSTLEWRKDVVLIHRPWVPTVFEAAPARLSGYPSMAESGGLDPQTAARSSRLPTGADHSIGSLPFMFGGERAHSKPMPSGTIGFQNRAGNLAGSLSLLCQEAKPNSPVRRPSRGSRSSSHASSSAGRPAWQPAALAASAREDG